MTAPQEPQRSLFSGLLCSEVLRRSKSAGMVMPAVQACGQA